jgi:TolB protein
VWTRDGKEILFVSNRGHIHGTGGFWRMRSQPGAEAREIHYEETNWKARPDFSPDGSRMVYSSYLGGQWHNLWVMPANGGDAFPLTYNGWDCTNVRWSPDGEQLAFITNYGGASTTRIEFQSVPGGPFGVLEIEKRNYMNPRGTIELRVVDSSGNDLPARISVTDENGRFLAPDSAWIHADDGFARSERPFEEHYFHLNELANLVVPVGRIKIDVAKGFEYKPVVQTVEVRPGDSCVWSTIWSSTKNSDSRTLQALERTKKPSIPGASRSSAGRNSTQAIGDTVDSLACEALFSCRVMRDIRTLRPQVCIQ